MHTPSSASRFVSSIALLSVAALTGCAATAPLSILQDNQVYYRANLDRYPVVVVQIDEKSNVFRRPVIDPGEHDIKFATTAVAGFSQSVEKTYRMNIAPCTRYYLAANRATSITQDWNLVIERTENVGGCDPVAELRKAGLPTTAIGPTGAAVLEAGAPPTLVRTTR